MSTQLIQSRLARMKIAVLLAGLFSAGLAAPLASADNEPAVQTHHEIRIGGKKLAYTAETGRVAIRYVETGEVHGQMFYIAYRLDGGDAQRPVTFVWNGGPGANSALLHFEIAGPKRLESDALVDNADTWLTDTDLVFVDPIGTGFSRPTKPEYAEEFYGTLGDVASVTEFVRAWLILHDATDRPVILAGESWGAGRAGQVGYRLLQRGVPVRGLVLISGGAGISQSGGPRELRQALQVVDRTATARFHDRLGEYQDLSANELNQQAEAWAREVYAPALQRIGELGETEKDQLISQLSGFTGMPAGLVDRDTLVINPRPYREGLLANAEAEADADAAQAPSQVLDVFDMRLLRDGDPADSGEGRAVRQQLILNYLRVDLGYRTVLTYLGTEALEQGYAPRDKYPQPVGYRWDYATVDVTKEEREAAYQAAIKHGGGPPQLGPPLPSAAEAVERFPQLQVLVAAGLYDSLNSCAGNDELASQLQEPLASAYAFKCYGGGHMMYRDVAAREALSQDVRAMARELSH